VSLNTPPKARLAVLSGARFSNPLTDDHPGLGSPPEGTIMAKAPYEHFLLAEAGLSLLTVAAGSGQGGLPLGSRASSRHSGDCRRGRLGCGEA
jgi:hypothetical protein